MLFVPVSCIAALAGGTVLAAAFADRDDGADRILSAMYLAYPVLAVTAVLTHNAAGSIAAYAAGCALMYFAADVLADLIARSMHGGREAFGAELTGPEPSDTLLLQPVAVAEPAAAAAPAVLAPAGNVRRYRKKKNRKRKA